MILRTFLTGLLTVFLCGSLFSQAGPAGDGTLRAGPSRRIHPSGVSQTEVFLVRSPLDPDLLFAACNTINFIPFFISEGIYVSADGGITWTGSDTCMGEPIAYHGGDPGIAIDRNGTFLLARKGREPFVGVYSHYSTDNGLTWSNQKVMSTDDLERAVLTSDVHPGSPFLGRTYAAWVKFTPPVPIMFSYSDNGAQTWSASRQVNNPLNMCAGGDLSTGPGGEVYLCWAGITDVSPFKEIHVGFARSADGGQNWQVNENAFAMNGITGVLPGKKNIRVNGLPQMAVDTTQGSRRGWIYIVTTQKDLSPAGSDPDVVLYRSTDGGQSWSAGIRVNQDALNNGKTQYFPNIHIDRYGAVDVLFYDDRTTTNDSTGVFLARSTDGGDTWREYEISDHHFQPAPIGGLGQGYQGDIIDLASTDSKIVAVWMDNSTGVYQVWTTSVEFSGLGEEDPPEGVRILQAVRCYPNPFFEKTTIGYHLAAAGKVVLQILDVYGREVATVVNESQAPGYHEISIGKAELQKYQQTETAVFFYRLVTGGGSDAGRMIWLGKDSSYLTFP